MVTTVWLSTDRQDEHGDDTFSGATLIHHHNHRFVIIWCTHFNTERAKRDSKGVYYYYYYYYHHHHHHHHYYCYYYYYYYYYSGSYSLLSAPFIMTAPTDIVFPPPPLYTHQFQIILNTV